MFLVVHVLCLTNGKNTISKFDERIFLGYSTQGKAYRVYNKITLVVKE